jgi:LacI family transcriptional regulator
MRRIGLMMNFTDFYDHGVARGVIQYAKQQSWELFGHGWMFGNIEDLSEWGGDGIVARIVDPEHASLIEKLEIPTVDVAGAYTDRAFACVTNDDMRTGSIAGEHLVGRGLRNIAYCGVSGVKWSEDRMRGMASAVGSVNIEISDAQTFLRPLHWWETPQIDDELVSFLQSLSYPAGLFAANDTVALNVIRAARRHQIVVPADIAVLGVDSEDITCELASPSLSSISLRLEEIGYAAAARLDRIVKGVEADAHIPLRIPPARVAERESSRVFGTADPIVRRTLEAIHSSNDLSIRVSELSEQVAVSRRNLEIRFRAETGRTVHSEIIRARMLRACDLLRESTAKMDTIAARSGFGSAQRFFAVFRRLTGLTPSEFRHADREYAERLAMVFHHPFPFRHS